MPVIWEKYRHYKNYADGKHDYEVLYVALHTETWEKLVIYRPAHATIDHTPSDIFARPLSMREDEVVYNGNAVKRFTLIEVK